MVRSFASRWISVAVVLLVAGVTASLWSLTRPSATVLSPTALRTTAPHKLVQRAVDKLYRELRLDHFRDESGRVVFTDGTSTDTTSIESARRMGDYVEGERAFDDPEGNRVTVNWYAEPGLGTLLTWDYSGGQDPQIVSVILQTSLADSGVFIE